MRLLLVDDHPLFLEGLLEAIRCGASGYLLKNMATEQLLGLLAALGPGEEPAWALDEAPQRQ